VAVRRFWLVLPLVVKEYLVRVMLVVAMELMHLLILLAAAAVQVQKDLTDHQAL
jgi:hypothetical protein